MSSPSRPLRDWLSTATGLGAVLGAVCGLALAVDLAVGSRVLLSVPGWFYPGSTASFSAVGIGLTALSILGLAGLTAIHHRLPTWALILSTIALGASLQHGLAQLEGNGLQALTRRMHSLEVPNHGEFLDIAIAVDDPVAVMTRYEALAQAGTLGRFAQSKPPGTLLTYMATERLANLGSPGAAPEQRAARARNLAAITWPLLSMTVVLPLFGLARRLGGEDVARYAVLLVPVIPGLQLITLHTDQALYPLVFTTCLALSAEAGARASTWMGPCLGGIAGLAVWLAASLSFPLAAAGGLGLLVMVALGGRASWRPALGLLLGVGLLDGLARVGLGYDMLERYQHALAFHAAWKPQLDLPGMKVYAPIVNVLEFAVFAGLPLALGSLGAAIDSMLGLREPPRPPRRLALGLVVAGSLAFVIYIAAFARTYAETARLWLFLTPLLALTVAAGIRRAGRPSDELLFRVFVGLQLLAVLTMKLWHDFV